MSAILSDCSRHRYLLTRKIPQAVRWVYPMLFIMLNPSTADAETDDATIRRCINFAKREGCTELNVVNMFSLRATDPKELKAYQETGALSEFDVANNIYLSNQIRKHAATGVIVCAWGSHKIASERFSSLLMPEGISLKCLGKTAHGHPRHPLYVRADQPLEDL